MTKISVNDSDDRQVEAGEAGIEYYVRIQFPQGAGGRYRLEIADPRGQSRVRRSGVVTKGKLSVPFPRIPVQIDSIVGSWVIRVRIIEPSAGVQEKKLHFEIRRQVCEVKEEKTQFIKPDESAEGFDDATGPGEDDSEGFDS